MNKKLSRVLTTIALSLVGVILIGILAFYLLIVVGLSPRLQTAWICSAAKTMSHKYLATAFFSDEYIEQVVGGNEIDDSGYESEILQFAQKTHEVESRPVEEIVVDPYVEEGYELLEDGIYIKEISGTANYGVPTAWKGKIMLVTDPTRIKLVDTNRQWVCGETVEMMVADVGAIAGINGGGFVDGVNYDSNGGTPMGLIIEDGQLVCPTQPDGYYYSMLGFNSEGAMILRHVDPQWALDNDIHSAVSALTFLIVNGENLINDKTGGWGIAPRTALGQRKTGEVLLLTIDGRQIDWSIGCDLDVLAEVMESEDAYNAAMVDGGTSTVMVYNGEIINKPSNGIGRYINNCFVVMPKK